MKPIEVVVSLLPTLTEAEKQVVREQLQFDPCSKQGHKFKVAEKLPAGWLKPASVRLYCERCSRTTNV